MVEPYEIDTLSVPEINGAIGICHCPGLHCHTVYEDIEVIKDWGADFIISLLEDEEYQFYGVRELNNSRLKGIPRLSLPIKDGSFPDSKWERRWLTYGNQVHKLLDTGGQLFIHCAGGLGRSGLVASIILIEFGLSSTEAIAKVRKARRGAIENSLQEHYIYQYSNKIRRPE